MYIEKISIHRLCIPRIRPTKVAMGELDSANNIALQIYTDTGLIGSGEASPFAPITGDTQDSNEAIAGELARLIIGKNPLAIEVRMAEINRFTVGEPSIRSAFDMALYDIAAQAANMPLYQFLGGELRTLRTDLTIGLQDSVEQTIERAKEILADGFDAIKLKVGRPGIEDVAHVKAVRELAGPEIAIKIDSNQGWDYPTAVANINAMTPLNLQYCEQPLAVWDYENMARLSDKVALPLCADESVFDEKDALKIIKLGAADYLNIKLGKAGGIHTGLKINALAEAAGLKCMISCFAESRLGLTAAAHLAVAKTNIAFPDLDSALSYKQDPVIGGMIYDKQVGGKLRMPDGVGLGATFDLDYIDRKSEIIVW